MQCEEHLGPDDLPTVACDAATAGLVSTKPTPHIEQGVGYARAAEADQPSSSSGGQETTQAPCSDQKDAEEASGVQRVSTMLQVKITFSAKVVMCFSASTIVIFIKLGMGAIACVQGVH